MSLFLFSYTFVSNCQYTIHPNESINQHPTYCGIISHTRKHLQSSEYGLILQKSVKGAFAKMQSREDMEGRIRVASKNLTIWQVFA